MKAIQRLKHFLLLLLIALAAKLPAEDIDKVEGLLQLKSPRLALEEIELLREQYPHSSLVMWGLAKTQAQLGRTREALDLLEKIEESELSKEKKDTLLEEISWNIIKKGARASSSKANYYALNIAVMTQQVEALPIALRFIRDQNPNLRAMSAHLSRHLGDYPLRSALLDSLKKEHHPSVVTEMISSLGVLQEEALLPFIKTILEENHPLSLQLAAVNAYEQISPKISKDKYTLLIKSPRLGLRILACRLIRKDFDPATLSLLLPLLSDSIPEVRAEAAYTLALSPHPLSNEEEEALEELSHISHPYPRTMALFALARKGQQQALEILKEFCIEGSPEEKELALAALLNSGPKAIPQVSYLLQESKDSLIKLNASTYLIAWGTDKQKALDFIEQFLKEHEGRIDESSPSPLFSLFTKSSVAHHPFIPNYPSLRDQLARLKLITVLSIYRQESTKEILKKYLQDKTWGISQMASFILVKEIPEEAQEILKELLKDPDPKVSVQAALVLVSVTKDFSALPVLYDNYTLVDNEIRGYILQALGQIGNASAIPFLTERLKDPLSSFQIIAAGSLIMCLNG